jgi:hypothetical protein
MFFPKMKPIKIDPDGVPVFISTDLEMYGFPEHWGYEMYRVVESREKEFVLDYDMEQNMDWRKVHRYSRLARFKATLLNLLGERGNIPQHVYNMVGTYLNPASKDKWNDTRKILKHYKQRRYYDNIPMILRQLKHDRCFTQVNFDVLESVVKMFMHLSDKFERTKQEYSRRYFPNIRFIVFKILDAHGIKPNYPVPQIRTTRKQKSLEALWVSLTK